ncbi:hypothetical protein QP177_06885, partial [Gardnerella vaginalis]
GVSSSVLKWGVKSCVRWVSINADSVLVVIGLAPWVDTASAAPSPPISSCDYTHVKGRISAMIQR